MQVRTNLVKMAISMYRKNEQKVCGGKAKVHRGENPDCINEMTALPLGNLMHWLQKACDTRIEYLDKAADQIAAVHVPVLDVFYEDLMADGKGTLNGMFDYFFDHDDDDENDDEGPSLAHDLRLKRTATSLKRTSNDLRTVISNYDAVLTSLQDLDDVLNISSCRLATMFADNGTLAFPDCDVPALARGLRSHAPSEEP